MAPLHREVRGRRRPTSGFVLGIPGDADVAPRRTAASFRGRCRAAPLPGAGEQPAQAWPADVTRPPPPECPIAPRSRRPSPRSGHPSGPVSASRARPPPIGDHGEPERAEHGVERGARREHLLRVGLDELDGLPPAPRDQCPCAPQHSCGAVDADQASRWADTLFDEREVQARSTGDIEHGGGGPQPQRVDCSRPGCRKQQPFAADPVMDRREQLVLSAIRIGLAWRAMNRGVPSGGSRPGRRRPRPAAGRVRLRPARSGSGCLDPSRCRHP
jgi:hypothetical protein